MVIIPLVEKKKSLIEWFVNVGDQNNNFKRMIVVPLVIKTHVLKKRTERFQK